MCEPACTAMLLPSVFLLVLTPTMKTEHTRDIRVCFSVGLSVIVAACPAYNGTTLSEGGSYMSYEQQGQRPHHLILAERETLTVSGVEEVDSFDEAEIVMTTNRGELIVRGSDLHIGKLSLDAGELLVSGQIDELCYITAEPRSGFWSRLFK